MARQPSHSPHRERAVYFDPTSVSGAAHRLLQANVQRIYLTLSFNLEPGAARSVLDALHGALRASSMPVWERKIRAVSRGQTSRTCLESLGG
jgi:hypothetical protein